MKKLLTILPTKERANKIGVTIESLLSTYDSSFTDVILCIDEGDEDMGKYQGIADDNGFLFYVNKAVRFCDMINTVFKLHNGYDFYHVTSDDMVYETKGWDRELAVEGKVSYGLEPGKPGFPITSVVDGNMFRAMGWLSLPRVDMYCADNATYFIGKMMDRLNYRKDIVISHNHPYYGKGEWDRTSKSNSRKEYRDLVNPDYQKMRKWLGGDILKDIEKIKEMELCQGIQEQKLTQPIVQ
jgi:hypothetical protein